VLHSPTSSRDSQSSITNTKEWTFSHRIHSVCLRLNNYRNCKCVKVSSVNFNLLYLLLVSLHFHLVGEFQKNGGPVLSSCFFFWLVCQSHSLLRQHCNTVRTKTCCMSVCVNGWMCFECSTTLEKCYISTRITIHRNNLSLAPNLFLVNDIINQLWKVSHYRQTNHINNSTILPKWQVQTLTSAWLGCACKCVTDCP